MNTVTDNRAEQEYELAVRGGRAVAAYQREDGVVTFTHTLVPPALEGRGIGTALIRGALDQVRDAGMKAIPQCPFVRAFIERHPAYRDLLA